MLPLTLAAGLLGGLAHVPLWLVLGSVLFVGGSVLCRRYAGRSARWQARHLRLGEILVYRLKWITPRQLRLALAQQARNGKRLGTILVEMGLLSMLQLAKALATQREHDRAIGCVFAPGKEDEPPQS